jgi:pimeloyl-ACP methyl ester carboxylesterase
MALADDLMIDGRAGRLAVRTKGLQNAQRDVAVLVQGANLSGQAGFDFAFPGGVDYSMMDMLVARGLAAVTFSVRGYAHSDVPADPLTVDTNAAIEDLHSVVTWLAGRGVRRPHLAGWSWGGRITARYAETHAESVGRLALLDPALGGGNKILPDPTEAWWSGGWQYFHDRLEEEYTEPAARRALADFVVQHEPKSPNGIRRENARGSVAPRAELITRPTLMIYGNAAGRQNYMQGGITRADFFEQLATPDKALCIIPGCGDYAHFQHPRKRLAQTIADFLMTGHDERRARA